MSHKAGKDFFVSKRPWSVQKDQILSYYLKPYLSKISSLDRPILVVDGFAGPGKYDDGKPGSPLLICNAVRAAYSRNHEKTLRAKVLLIERDAELRSRLDGLVEQYDFAETAGAGFAEHISRIESAARRGDSIFIYIDPFTVSSLSWPDLDGLLSHLDNGTSIEVLINFNSAIFCRSALAYLAMNPTERSAVDADIEEQLEYEGPPTKNRLDLIAGGDWWLPIMQRTGCTFSDRVEAVSSGFARQLRTRFRETCRFPVRWPWNASIPKYDLIFGSRTSHALVLMNDAVAKAHERIADEVAPREEFLFDQRPADLIPMAGDCESAILGLLTHRMTRKELEILLVREHFGKFSTGDFKKCVKSLLGTKVDSNALTKRLNDESSIWRINLPRRGP